MLQQKQTATCPSGGFLACEWRWDPGTSAPCPAPAPESCRFGDRPSASGVAGDWHCSPCHCAQRTPRGRTPVPTPLHSILSALVLLLSLRDQQVGDPGVIQVSWALFDIRETRLRRRAGVGEEGVGMPVLLGDVRGRHHRAPVGLLAPPFLVRDFSFCHCAWRVSQVWGWPSPPSPARGRAGLAQKQYPGRGVYRHSPTQRGALPAPHTPQTRMEAGLAGCVLRSFGH